jgi:hypothetical protein
VHRLEAEIAKLDKRYMTWIVKNKNILWTWEPCYLYHYIT